MRPLPLLLAFACVTTTAAAQVARGDSAYLVTTTQALLDAVTSGDTAVWAPVLAPDWLLSDEEGAAIGRKEFLAGLHGLPAGQSGKLTVRNWHLTGRPGVIVMTYDADEEHHYYGQLLLTVFHQTDTWIKAGGHWLQLASQATALPHPIAGRPVAAALSAEYTGSYALTPEIKLTIAADDSGLVINRTGRPGQRLYALDDRLFIRHGVRGFWVFERDSAGKVAELVNWRDNNRVTWRREE